MKNTIDAAMEHPIPIEKKNNTDAEETDMKKINTAAIKETGPEADDVKLVESAYIYKSEEDRGLTLHNVPVQQQSGITDCGVFAVAFAYHAAIGDELERIIFDQGQMRKHLLRCFEKKELSRFPHKLLRSRGECKFQYIALHCYDHCKLPESYDNLLGCDSFDQWYHYITAWFCKNCQQ